VTGAILSFGWWDEADEDAREQFDEAYADAQRRAVAVLGEPLIQGKYRDEDGYRWAVWRGRTALFVLEQSGDDPQFGQDIHFRICPWSGPDPRRDDPFPGWLDGLRG
jgi:hypothetical protein